METTEELFSNFSPVTKDQWKAKAIEDLKGSDFDKKLVWKTDDEFNIQPFYTPEDIENDLLKNQRNVFSAEPRTWTNYVQIDGEDPVKANKLALEMKKFGATGFLFRFEKKHRPDFDILLQGLNPESECISFSVAEPSLPLISQYFEFLEKNRYGTDKINGFYESDVLEKWITEGQEPDFSTLADILKVTRPVRGFKGLTIKSHAFVNAGSNTKQEIAYTLNKLTDSIDKLSEKGLKTSEVINEAMLHMSITGDYFFEIAKIRALKILLKSISGLYSNQASDIKVLSSNALWSKSLYDPHVNMLRNTTEAMSAILGGCDAILSIPHDSGYQEPTAFSKRIALNISNILKEESYFDKVSDPSAGSYYIENLTHALTESALGLFKEIEDKGGFIAAFKANIIQEKIKVVRDKKEKEIASRKRVFVGTNKYPNLKERISATPQAKADSSLQRSYQLLVSQRVTKSFDDLRNRTQTHFLKTGFTPKVYLACFGNLAMRKARAGFATDFFGTAGFEIMGEFVFDDVQKAAEESALSQADIVVICSSDQDYESHALPFVRKFKSLAAGKSLVLAGYPESLAEELKKDGLDQFIHLKTNAIEILTDFQTKFMAD